MQNEDKDCRRVAARALGQAGEGAKDAVPDLIQVLQDQDQGVRRFATQALGKIGEGTVDIVPALMQALTGSG